MLRTGQYIVLCLLAGCAGDGEVRVYDDAPRVPVVTPVAETLPVYSYDDTANDTAIWFNYFDPASSLILATDTSSGLMIYTLDGSLRQYIPVGRPNSVDLRQGIRIGAWQGDLAAASNRADDTVTLFGIDEDGSVILGSVASLYPDPYGSCLAMIGSFVFVFVTHQAGEVVAYELQNIDSLLVTSQVRGELRLQTPLDSCAYDDQTGTLYLGATRHGLWKSTVASSNRQLSFSTPALVDEVDGYSGLRAQVRGVAVYRGNTSSYVIVSSQGNDSYAVYSHDDENTFLGRFRIAASPDGFLDGTQETAGLDVTGRTLGESFPRGILVVQDGINGPNGTEQNFKIIDWREIERALGL